MLDQDKIIICLACLVVSLLLSLFYKMMLKRRIAKHDTHKVPYSTNQLKLNNQNRFEQALDLETKAWDDTRNYGFGTDYQNNKMSNMTITDYIKNLARGSEDPNKKNDWKPGSFGGSTIMDAFASFDSFTNTSGIPVDSKERKAIKLINDYSKTPVNSTSCYTVGDLFDLGCGNKDSLKSCERNSISPYEELYHSY